MKTCTRRQFRRLPRPFATGIMLTITIVFLSGCTTTRHHDYAHHSGPSASLSIEYHYFPDVDVYYDVRRHLYHYHHTQRGWLTVKTLPHYIRIDRRQHNVVRSRHQRPWQDRHAHKRPRSYSDKRHSPRTEHPEKSRPRHESRRDQTPHREAAHYRDGKRERTPQQAPHQERKQQARATEERTRSINKARPAGHRGEHTRRNGRYTGNTRENNKRHE